MRQRTAGRAKPTAKATAAPRREAAGAAQKKRPATKTTTATKAALTVAATPSRPTRAAKSVPALAPAAPPVPRRMIFIDVENTSGEADLLRVIDHLQIDRKAQPTEVVAVGNWRTIGAKIARMLAAAGVHLVHSAPAVGVRDWSDLWIAVSAGRWLGTARPGDRLEVVSDDRAFDAVADAAANCGVDFYRLSYRTLHGAVELTPELPPSRSRRRRASRRRATERGQVVPSAEAVPEPVVASSDAPQSAEDRDAAAHAASQEQVRVALARLSLGDAERWIGLDALANLLRSEGFTRPSGSPRLITRLRRMRDIEVNQNGMVRLAPHLAPPAAEHAAPAVAEPAAAESPEPAAAPAGRPRRPRGRRRRPAEKESAAQPEVVPVEAAAETPYSGVT